MVLELSKFARRLEESVGQICQAQYLTKEDKQDWVLAVLSSADLSKVTFAIEGRQDLEILTANLICFELIDLKEAAARIGEKEPEPRRIARCMLGWARMPAEVIAQDSRVYNELHASFDLSFEPPAVVAATT